MSDELTALFVRVPRQLSEELALVAHETGRTKQSVVTELLTTGSSAVQDHSAVDQSEDVLNMHGLCALLDVSPEHVLQRLADGEFPGRRLGSEWRFSKPAVMAWLAGTDHVGERTVGFSGT